jgi:hypothetical protein
LNQRMKEVKNRERLLKKLAEKKMAQAHAQQAHAKQFAQQAQSQQLQANEEEVYTEPPPKENLVFSKGEQAERSTRDPPAGIKKKKKNKKNE